RTRRPRRPRPAPAASPRRAPQGGGRAGSRSGPATGAGARSAGRAAAPGRRAGRAPRRAPPDRPGGPSGGRRRAAVPSRDGCGGRALLAAAWPALYRPLLAHRLDGVGIIAEPGENLVGMLAEQRRAAVLDRRIRQVDRHADLDIAAARRMVELDQHLAGIERLVLVDVLYRQDRPARHVDLIER